MRATSINYPKISPNYFLMNLNQVAIPSVDLERSIPFYKKLGLKLIVRALPHYARFECPVGEATFSIHQTEQLPTGEGIYVYFECADLDERVAQLQQQGIVFELEPTDQRWGWREARLRDPDDHLLILFWAGDNRRNPPWRLEEA